MKFTIYTSSTVGNPKNCVYPNRIVATNEDEMAVAMAFDHVCAEYKNNYRNNENFMESDTIMMDCDNDHSEEPSMWITPENIYDMLPDVNFAIVPSRHNMLSKNDKAARPRFHIYFEIPLCKSADDYASIKRGIHSAFPFLDDKALDAARFVFGSDAGNVDWHEGWMTIDELLEQDDGPDVAEKYTTGTYEVGTRNSSMSRFAAKVLKRYGISEKARELFLKEAEKCCPPLPEEELETIWKSAEKFAKKVTTADGYISPDVYNDDFGGTTLCPEDYSDIGQAKVIAREYGEELMYTDSTDFLVYNGERWLESKQMAVGTAEEFLDRQYKEAQDMVKAALDALEKEGIDKNVVISGDKKLKAVLDDDTLKLYYAYLSAVTYEKFALKRRDIKYITSALQAVKPMLLHDIKELDANEFLLNVPGLTFDLRKGMKGGREPRAEDFITKQAKCKPGTKGEKEWREALNTFFCNDKDLIDYVQLIVGLAAIGKVYNEALIIAYGEGRNGKSTFWNAVNEVLGSYSGTISADTLTVGCKRNIKPEIAELKGKRLVIAAELEEGMRLNTSIVKQLCSTDEIEAEKKYKDPFHFTPSHTVVLYTNHLPRVGACDDGTWRRLIVIPFNAKIEGNSDIKNYADWLVTNAGEAIMKWVIEGAYKVINLGYKFSVPDCVKNAIKKYREGNDWMSSFIEDCCDVETDAVQKSGEFYQEYRAYCLRNGEYTRSTSDFYSTLENYGYVRKKTKTGSFIYGIKLKNSFN